MKQINNQSGDAQTGQRNHSEKTNRIGTLRWFRTGVRYRRRGGWIRVGLVSVKQLDFLNVHV